MRNRESWKDNLRHHPSKSQGETNSAELSSSLKDGEIKIVINQPVPYRREETSVVSEICVRVEIFRILCALPP